MSAPACTGVPVSWLRLEQYHAGDLSPEERDEIARHLRACDACASCLARIVDDDRALPPLPVLRPRRLQPGRAAAFASALALAATVLFFVGRRPKPEAEAADRTKGTGIAFTLVRESEGLLPEAGGVYRDGERMKALVTCPPGLRASWDLVVLENGVAAFPLAPSEVACGNEVPMPGAFRVTGRERMTVCLVWDDGGPVDREALRHAAPETLPNALCKTLDPAP